MTQNPGKTYIQSNPLHRNDSFKTKVPIINLPLNMVAVFGCLGGAIVTILNLLYKISDGGVGKNGSSVAVSLNGHPILTCLLQTNMYQYFRCLA